VGRLFDFDGAKLDVVLGLVGPLGIFVLFTGDKKLERASFVGDEVKAAGGAGLAICLGDDAITI
jgi:hypothetical protein